jgi:hypothetical protein
MQQVANRDVRGFGWEIAHAAVTRRPPSSLYTVVPRTGSYAHDVGIWDLSIIQGPFSVAPCQTLAYDSQLVSSLQVMVEAEASREGIQLTYKAEMETLVQRLTAARAEAGAALSAVQAERDATVTALVGGAEEARRELAAERAAAAAAEATLAAMTATGELAG